MHSRLALYAMLLAAVALAGCMYANYTGWSLARGGADFDYALQLMADGKYEEAAGQLAPLAAEARAQGRPDLASKALFWQGYCSEKMGRTDDAVRLYDEVMKSYAGTAAARQAAERAGLLNHERLIRRFRRFHRLRRDETAVLQRGAAKVE